MREGARDRVTRGHVMVYIINTTPRTRVKGSKDLRISGSPKRLQFIESSYAILRLPHQSHKNKKKKATVPLICTIGSKSFSQGAKCECSRPHRQRQGVRFSPTSLIEIDEPGTCTTLYTRQQPSLLTQKKSSS